MKKYSCKEKPIKVFGVPFWEQTKRFERLPLSVRTNSKHLDFSGRRCPGARIGFRTDSPVITIKVILKSFTPDIGMSIFSCQSVNVMIGDRQKATFAGLVNPPNYNEKVFEKTFYKEPKMEEITLWLLRNEEIEDVEISISEEAIIEEPTPYKYGPALYYGSSITEGGCCCNVTNSYSALLCRWLDLDFYNLGFSGNAKGEIEMADYINTINFNMFVYDYDHNAPSVEHLENTHEAFFRHIREKNPKTPILMLSKPNFDFSQDAIARRDVIRRTFLNALADGDRNVYFLDGEVFFEEEDRELCTIDTIHPNDLGFYRMAKAILPVMKKVLEERVI